MRIIDEEKEYIVRCNHCYKRIGFNINDVFSTYRRGLEMGDGWIDGDMLWHYISCPYCDGNISVNRIVDDEDFDVLYEKYNNSLN